jgi:hypothetical protein
MTEQLLAVLKEGYEGLSEGGWFLDGPDAGLRNTLARLSPEEASRPWGGNSIAAHARHIRFSLGASAAWISGDRASRDWNESWNVSTVGPEEWSALQRDLGAGYDELRTAIASHAAKDPETLAGAVGAIAHVVYHVGAIRQKVAAARV